jgi:hypothetical protein
VAAPRHQCRDGGEYGQDAWQTHQAMLSWARFGPAASDLRGCDLAFC